MKTIRATQLTEKQTEALLELYTPIRLLAKFHRQHPDDDAFWHPLQWQQEIDPNGRIIARLTNLGLAVSDRRRQGACKLTAAGAALAAEIYRQRHGALDRVA